MAEMAAVAGVLALAGVAGSTYAGVQSAKMQAKAAEREAESAQQAAAFEEQQYRRKAAIARGKGEATAAASGLDISTGSPLLLDLENARQTELEALNIRRGGQFAAESKRYEATLARSTIPGTIFGGIAHTGSILSTFAARRGPGAQYTYGPGYSQSSVRGRE